MKKNLLKSAVLLASLLGALSSASAETLHARIPFSFSAGGTSMPAGTYTIKTMVHAHEVLLFENQETKVQTMVFARTTAGASVKPATLLMFTTYSGEPRELAMIAADEWSFELSTQSARKSLKGVALTLTSAGK
jgi:hypothetical protein